MKDVLLKILNTQITAYKEEPVNHHNHPEFVNVIIDGFENTATEIADIVKAFAEWKDVRLTMNNMSFDKDHGVYVWDHKVWEYNDLFNYWYNEIREK